MTVFKACCYISWVALALAMCVAQYAFENHLGTTIMDPAGRWCGFFELVALVSCAIGWVSDRWTRS